MKQHRNIDRISPMVAVEFATRNEALAASRAAALRMQAGVRAGVYGFGVYRRAGRFFMVGRLREIRRWAPAYRGQAKRLKRSDFDRFQVLN